MTPNNTGTAADRRGPRPARRQRARKVGRGGLVLAGKGDGWALWVPVDQWDAMTDHERAELARRQAALLEGGKSAA